MSKRNCTYKFTGPDGKEQTIQGMAAMKAFLADGGLEFFYPDGKFPWLKTEAAQLGTDGAIRDFGEKIGGARKDTASSTGRKPKATTQDDDRPAWARRFIVNQIVKAPGQINDLKDEGRWVIRDKRSLDWMKQPKLVSRATYATQEEAEAAIPLAAVAQKHRAMAVRNGDSTGYEIWREVSDRKRVKVVDRVFDTREDAMRYMAENAQAIIETNTTFGEADLPRPPSEQRLGEARRVGDVKDSAFTDVFGFRGVEFGNWNNQEERQQLLNDAYDGLLDLAEVMAIPPRAISLNGELALAFGARGHGLSGARAHYELDKSVINLTKMNGAGSLAHEWFHALDHYFGRQDGKASAEWVTGKDGTRSFKVSPDTGSSMVTSGTRGDRSGMRAEMREAYAALMDTIKYKAESYVEDTARTEKFVAAVRNEVKQQLDDIRRYLADQLDQRYYKRNNKPASAEQLAEFDSVAEKIINGESLDLVLGKNEKARSVMSGMRWTNDALNKINDIMKAVRGRQGFNADGNGRLDRLRGSMSHYSSRLKMLAEAQKGGEKTRKVPTQFMMDAKELDQGRGTDYWTTPHELGARAFQGFVEDKIAAQGGQSPFLNYGPENVGIPTPWGYKRPFPAGPERQAINAALEKLVGTLKTKETDKGVALFSVAPESTPAASMEVASPAGSISQVELDSVIKGALNGWKAVGGDMIATVQSAADLPAEIVQGAKDQGLDLSKVEGVQHRGKVYLVRDNLRGTDHAQRVLFHEVLGHLGVKGALSGKTKETMRVLWAKLGGLKGVEAMARKIDAGDGKTVWDRLQPYTKGGALTLDRQAIIMDELIAYIAQGNDQRPMTRFKAYLSNLKADVVGLLRKLKLGDLAGRLDKAGAELDVLALVRDARKAIETGKTRDGKTFTFTVGKPSESHAGATNDEPLFSIASSIKDKINERKTTIVGSGGSRRVLTPEQTKAMANVGFQVQEPSMADRAKALWKDAGKKLAQGIADQFAPVKELDGKAYSLLRLAKGASGAFEVLLQGGKLKLSDGVYDFDEKNRGGVIDKLLKPLGGEHHYFLQWVAANRAERLMAEGKENLFTPEDVRALKTLAAGQTDFDYTIQNGVRSGQVTRDRATIYADSLATFNGFNKNVLDLAEQSGLIDGDSRSLWEQEFYVPFNRVADEMEGGVRGMNIKGGAVRQEAFKKLKGGKQALNADLLDNTLMNWAHLLDASAKNRAAKATLEAAANMGVAVEAPEATVQQMGRSINKKGGAVWFMDAGVKRHFLVDDPYLMTAITSLEYAGMRGPMMDAMGAFKHALTVGVTASPFFKVRNLIRDSLQVVAVSKIGANPLANVKEGWKLTDPHADAYFRLMAGGGTIHFGTMMEGSEAKRVQALAESGVESSTILDGDKKVKAFYRRYVEPAITAYNELGNRGEAVNRAALYKQLTSQGVSHAEASLMARDLMDFSMQGSFTSVRFLTQVVPFLNARIQGLYKLGRGAKEDPQRFAAVIGATALMSVALLAAYSDDDDWKKREEWDRNNYWWFKLGGTAFRIPKPFEIGAMATLAERGVELLIDDEMTGERFRKQILTLLGDNLSMNPIPQLVKPMLDVYSNKDSFSGRPIETMGMERLLPQYRYNDRTSMLARGASSALNGVAGVVGGTGPSPVQIDHMIRGYFGWLGSFVVGASDILARPATGQADRSAPDYWKTATGGIISELDGSASRYVSQMYEQSKAIEQAYGTWRSLLKEGRAEEAAAFREDRADQIAANGMATNFKTAQANLNNQIRVIERSTTMSAAEKREAINAIRERQDQAARGFRPVGA